MPKVVVSGAGPVGLWLAAELSLRNVSVVVVESRSAVSPHSKALTIHPRTLELFAQRGIIDDFLKAGIRVPAGHFGALEQKLDFAPLETDFPFTLLFPQAETERVLEERARKLGADIRRGHTLVGLEQQPECVRVDVDTEGGPYSLDTSYVVGCDGAGSTVRKLSDIAFPGTDADTFGILADVILSTPPATPLYSHAGSTGQVMIVPLPGGAHRIVGVDPAHQQPQTSDLDFVQFRESVLNICGEDFGMHSPRWVSRYGNASRLADRYVKGRIALAGDAAHMHFPAGGVGMNVGIQDAHALGWRLADVISGLSRSTALEDYHRERHAVGADLVRSTQAQTAILCSFDHDGRALRSLLNQLIGDVPELSLALANRLSALSVAYPATGPAHPLVGRRLAATAMTLSSVQPILVTDQDIDDATAALLDRAQITVTAADSGPAMLLRPDGHVAWAAEAADASPEAISQAVRTLRPLAFATD